MPTTTMSSTPSNTELVSILQKKVLSVEECEGKSGVSPQTNHRVCSNVSRLLLQFPEQFIPHVTRQLGQALDFSPDETLEARADVTENVPALDLTGQDEALVLQALAHAGLSGGVHLHSLYLCLGRHGWTELF